MIKTIEYFTDFHDTLSLLDFEHLKCQSQVLATSAYGYIFFVIKKCETSFKGIGLCQKILKVKSH
jgi:hypothetical protein